MQTHLVSILLALCLLTVSASTSASADQSGQSGSRSVLLPLIQNRGAGDPPLDEDAWAVPGQFVVTWKSDPLPAEATAALPEGELRVEPLNIDVVDVSDLVATGDTAAVAELLESLEHNPDVEAVEPNYIYTTLETPNDPDLSRQWAWDVTQAYDAWEVTRGSPNVVIAIIDTGIQLDHPDLDDKLVSGYDFVGNDTTPDDGNGHGTHVAGTAAAETNNRLGGAGFCPECVLMPVRALNNGGSGSLSDIAQAIAYAADNGADVINLSLGGAGSTTLQRAIDYAWSKGVFLTCAAGNSSTNQRAYPAAFANCFAVAATTSSDQRASFSNYGPWVDIAAPGAAIYSTYRGSRYGNLSGTSMAAPHVAGLAGLLAAQGLTNTQIGDRLCSTADRIEGTGTFWSCGRINALRAVGGSSSSPVPTAPTTEAPSPSATPDPAVTATTGPTTAPTPTASPPAGPEPTPGPGDSGAIINGGFEAGLDPWVASADDILATDQAWRGAYSARLGGEDSSTDTLEQVVRVPADGILTYYWLPVGTNDRGDQLRLEVTIEGSQSRLSIGLNATNGRWYKRSVNLGGLAGRTVRIRFSAITNDHSPTTFYVDDVSLK